MRRTPCSVSMRRSAIKSTENRTPFPRPDCSCLRTLPARSCSDPIPLSWRLTYRGHQNIRKKLAKGVHSGLVPNFIWPSVHCRVVIVLGLTVLGSCAAIGNPQQLNPGIAGAAQPPKLNENSSLAGNQQPPQVLRAPFDLFVWWHLRSMYMVGYNKAHADRCRYI